MLKVMVFQSSTAEQKGISQFKYTQKFERILILVEFLCQSRRASGEEKEGKYITSGLFLLSLYPVNDTSMLFHWFL